MAAQQEDILDKSARAQQTRLLRDDGNHRQNLSRLNGLGPCTPFRAATPPNYPFYETN